MADAVCIGPFPVLLPPPNARHGRKTFDGGSLVSQQRAMVRAAFSGRCSVCGAPATAVRPRGATWSGAIVTHGCTNDGACSCKAGLRSRAMRLTPYQLPTHGPGHPVDVHVVRVPRYRGRPLDAHENLPFACKPIVDEVTLQLWPKGPDGKPVGKPDDSAAWLRWSYGERPHRKARKRPRPGDWMPDPPNKGTELCEIWIAGREDCECYCGELRQAARQWAGNYAATPPPAPSAEASLYRAVMRLTESCGCGRSMLPVRWERGL